MQSSIYNFYCLNTLAKHFYRLNPTLSFSNYKLSITPDITVSSVSNIIPNKLLVFKTDVQCKNERFIETVSFSQPDKDRCHIKYNIDVLNDLELNTSLKLDRFFDIKTPPKMNPYFWCNLSSENQTELYEISKLLELVQTDKAKEFTIYK